MRAITRWSRMVEAIEHMTDEELARQSQAGSLTAFEELVSRYEHRVFALINRSCSNQADASELTQDTFVKAFRAIARYDARLCFRTWLFTIARRTCIDHYRAKPPVSNEPVPEMSDVVDPAELLARREDRQDLWQVARQRLSEAQFHALWFLYAEEMEVAEVARILGKTQTHVKVLLFRARRTLARELGGRRARASVPKPQPMPARPTSSVGGPADLLMTIPPGTV